MSTVMKIATTAERSRMMAGIRGKNTRPEKTLRSLLFAQGFRYRLHVRHLPGTPDLVLPRFDAAIFVHGCFWHRHQGCHYTTVPKSNADFWQQKFQETIIRDQQVLKDLQNLGWRVAVVWECSLKRHKEKATQILINWLHTSESFIEIE